MGSSSSKPEVWPWGSAPSWMVTWKHTMKTTTVYPNKKNPWTFQIPHEVIHSFAYFGYLCYWKTRSLFDLSSDSQSWFVSSPEAPPIKKPTMKMCCACPETKVFGSGQRWMLTMTSQLIRYYLQCFLVWSVVIWVCLYVYLSKCHWTELFCFKYSHVQRHPKFAKWKKHSHLSLKLWSFKPPRQPEMSASPWTAKRNARRSSKRTNNACAQRVSMWSKTTPTEAGLLGPPQTFLRYSWRGTLLAVLKPET